MTQVTARILIILIAMIAAGVIYSSPCLAIVKAFLYLLLLAYVGAAFVKDEEP